MGLLRWAAEESTLPTLGSGYGYFQVFSDPQHDSQSQPAALQPWQHSSSWPASAGPRHPRLIASRSEQAKGRSLAGTAVRGRHPNGPLLRSASPLSSSAGRFQTADPGMEPQQLGRRLRSQPTANGPRPRSCGRSPDRLRPHDRGDGQALAVSRSAALRTPARFLWVRS
jgi:hypothetical protein